MDHSLFTLLCGLWTGLHSLLNGALPYPLASCCGLSVEYDSTSEDRRRIVWIYNLLEPFFSEELGASQVALWFCLWKSLSCWLFETPWIVVHGILQARWLEWVAFPFSRGSSQPRRQTQVSRVADWFLPP